MTEYETVQKYLRWKIPEFRYSRSFHRASKSLIVLVGGFLVWSLIGIATLSFIATLAEFDFEDSAYLCFLAIAPLFGLAIGHSNRHCRWEHLKTHQRIVNSFYLALDDLRCLFSKDHSSLIEISTEILVQLRASRQRLQLAPLVEAFTDRKIPRAEVAESLRILREYDLVLQNEKTVRLQPKVRNLR